MYSTITTQQVMVTSSSVASSLLPSPTSLPPAVQCDSKYKYDIYLCSKDTLVAIVSESDKSALLYEWIEGVLKRTSTSIDSFKKTHSNCLSQYKGSTTKGEYNSEWPISTKQRSSYCNLIWSCILRAKKLSK